jgi:hypothetical protein
VATSVPIAFVAGVVAVGVPVKEGDEIIGDTIVLLLKVSAPVKVASVPVVGKIIFVTPVLVKVVLKLPAVIKSAVVEILPPRLIVFVPLFTPVPPKVPVMAAANGAVPSKSLPYTLTGEANFVLELALPAKLAVIIFALKLPLSSLFTKVLGVLFAVGGELFKSNPYLRKLANTITDTASRFTGKGDYRRDIRGYALDKEVEKVPEGHYYDVYKQQFVKKGGLIVKENPYGDW